MDASAEGSLLRSSRENLPAGAVLGGRPARSAPLVPPAPSREVPAAPSREEPSVDAQVDALADTLDDGDDDDDDAAEASSPRDILERLRSEQPSASAEGSILRQSREQQASSREQSVEDTDAQVEQLADILDEDDDAAAAPAPAATDAQQVDQLADILDDDASDMDVFAQGSPRISMGGSSFADESKADDASSSLLESKDFQLHEGGHSDSDA